mmetsp:Transcript_16582/g.62746  ORF Transcript_16582/g.62746 Transcript_16582/m.62746 type:complete len:259 (+) Transcript_16582:177-953(+)
MGRPSQGKASQRAGSAGSVLYAPSGLEGIAASQPHCAGMRTRDDPVASRVRGAASSRASRLFECENVPCPSDSRPPCPDEERGPEPMPRSPPCCPGSPRPGGSPPSASLRDCISETGPAAAKPAVPPPGFGAKPRSSGLAVRLHGAVHQMHAGRTTATPARHPRPHQIATAVSFPSAATMTPTSAVSSTALSARAPKASGATAAPAAEPSHVSQDMLVPVLSSPVAASCARFSQDVSAASSSVSARSQRFQRWPLAYG